MNAWMVSEAKACSIDAAVMLSPESQRISVSGNKFTKASLEAAGVPVFEISADMVDATDWSHDRMVDEVERFLRERVPLKAGN